MVCCRQRRNLCRVYSSCFMHAIVEHMRLPFFKVFSNILNFCPNFQILCPFLSFFCPFSALFLKNYMHVLTFYNRPCFGSYFFEDNDGNHLSVNAEWYIKMMCRKFVLHWERREALIWTLWCSSKIECHLVAWAETFNTSGSTFQKTDSFQIEPITPGQPIPQISTPPDSFLWD